MYYYISLAKKTLKEGYAYKLNFIFSFLVEFIPILGYLCIVHFTYKNNYSFGQYSYEQALTYYILVRFFWDLFAPTSWFDICNDIRKGSLNYHLSKPYSYFFHNFVVYYSLKVIYYLFSTVIICAVVLMMHKSMYIPIKLSTYILFLTNIALSLILSFQIIFVISILSFWLIDNSFIDNLLGRLMPLLMGMLLPLDIFPKVISQLFELLPFQYLIFSSASIFLEKLSLFEVTKGFSIEIGWILILLLLQKILWTKGIKRYEANG